MTRKWNEFWFRPTSRAPLVATRVILALQALWIVASRPDLPLLTGWPDPFWSGVPQSLAIRYAVTRSVPLEVVLYVATAAILLAAAFGVAERYTCIAAGLLLYHFAPMEEIITGAPLTSFRGLTQSTFGLMLIGFASASRDEEHSGEYRWPVAATQFLMTLTYFFAALAKLHDAGIGWVAADNVRAIAMTFATWGVRAPLAPWLIAHEWVCGAVAAGTMAVELTFPLVLVSRTAAKLLVPLIFLAHVGMALTLGIFFLSTPLLLLFIDWEWVAARAGRGAAAGRATTAPSHPL